MLGSRGRQDIGVRKGTHRYCPCLQEGGRKACDRGREPQVLLALASQKGEKEKPANTECHDLEASGQAQKSLPAQSRDGKAFSSLQMAGNFQAAGWPSSWGHKPSIPRGSRSHMPLDNVTVASTLEKK